MSHLYLYFQFQDTFCDELYDMLKKKKKEMLQVAKRCFRNANHCEDGGEPEEAWLHHYMLGKISEKEGEGPIVYLDHYKKAIIETFCLVLNLL